MSDLWIPKTAIEAEWTMKIEAAKFERMQAEATADKITFRIARIRAMMDEVKRNLEFLSSHQAKIILILEYRAARRNLLALRAEEANLSKQLSDQEHAQDRLSSEIKSLEEEAAKVGKVLRFRGRGQNQGT